MTTKCHLWKPKNDPLLIICDLRDDPLKFKGNHFSTDDYIFTYKGKTIKIIFKDYSSNTIVKYPLIYSEEQTIDLNEEKDYYYFKFKTGLFYDTRLFLKNIHNNMLIYIPFDDCEVKDREMTCKMTRKKIESFIFFNQFSDKTLFSTISFSGEYGDKLNYLVYYIYFLKNKKKQKQDIYVELQNLISYKEEYYRYIAYKTNITNFPSIQTRPIYLYFKNPNKEESRLQCFFKNNGDNTPLMFLCFVEVGKDNILMLDDFRSQNNISVFSQNYNFIISYPKRENFTIIDKYGAYFFAKYPDVLDFTTKNEINFTLSGVIGKKLKYTLNPKSQGFYCDAISYVIHCKVTKSHFEGEKSGDFSLYYINSLGEKSKFYELSPFKVILKGSNLTKINKLIYILALLLFI